MAKTTEIPPPIWGKKRLSPKAKYETTPATMGSSMLVMLARVALIYFIP
jgi:hypothetical protein